MASSEDGRRGYAFFEFVNERIKWVSIVVVVVAVALGMVGPLVASEDQPTFNPSGEIYDTDDRVVDRFDVETPIQGALYLIEVPDAPLEPTAMEQDVLTAAVLREFKTNSDAVRAKYSTGADAHMATEFDNDLGLDIDGIFSIADAVDAVIPGGLAEATDADVKLALSDLLADGSPTASLRFTLSQRLTSREPGEINGQPLVVWRSPAFFAFVRYEVAGFVGGPTSEGFDGKTYLDAERWLRSVQTELRGGMNEMTVWGVAIDGGLVNEEQGEVAAPFIFLAVAFILLLVGALLRSYWAMVVAAMGLGIVMMSYNGINSLIGLKVQSPLIILIVPIALISFGIDFYIHGAGRAREAQVEGVSRRRAYPIGATALFTALILAASSSVGAFLSNAVSGIEAITEFGIAAAVSITLSYLMLGLIAPRQLLAIEEALGPRPEDHGLHVFRRLGFLVVAALSGVVVTMTIVMPAIGAPLYVVFQVGAFFLLPYWWTKRRNRKAAETGKPMTDAVKGAGHGFRAAGTVVHFLARWRVFTVPVVVVLAVLGGWAFFQVEEGFVIKDFFSSRTDFVKSIDKIETYQGSSASGSGYIYYEGDLTDPDTLLALETIVTRMDGAERNGEFELVRDFDGDLETPFNALQLVRLVMETPPITEAVSDGSGVELTDADGNGLPDAAAQVAAIYEYTHAEGVPVGDTLVLRADQIQQFLYLGDGGATQGTLVAVIAPSFSDDENVLAMRAELDRIKADLDSQLTAAGVDYDVLSVSGGAIRAQGELSSFTSSMRTSLPLAIAITLVLALLVMRSARYALITMVPIILVVAWIYAFMYLANYRINVITATIAAIAIGVGIDYATHFTVRFREEFRGEPSRFPALRRAGEGTGGALALSALTSMTGFLVMATAPMPMFATFGVLTAVMIFFALLVSLLVLPSLLILPFVTPSRKGEERARLEEAITGGRYEYEPHARETATMRSLEVEIAPAEDVPLPDSEDDE